MEKDECIVCMDNPRNTKLIPCLHEILCENCATRLLGTDEPCPLCFMPIYSFNVSESFGFETYQKPSKNDESVIDECLLKARNLWLHGDFTSALEALDGMADPDSAEAIGLRASCNFVMGDVSKSGELAFEAIRKDPESLVAHMAIAQYHRYTDCPNVEHSVDDVQKAFDRFEAASLFESNDVFLLTVASIVYRLRHDVPQLQSSIILSTRAIALDRKCCMAYNSRGNAFAEDGKFTKALSDINTAIELCPELGFLRTNRGNCYFSLGNDEKALEDQDEAIRLNQNDGNAYLNRGLVYEALNRYCDAIEDYSKAVMLNTVDSLAYRYRGTAHRLNGNFQEAIEDAEMAIRLNNNDFDAYICCGLAHNKSGKYEEAISDFSEALALVEDRTSDMASNRKSSILCFRGISKYRACSFEEALVDLDRCLSIVDEDDRDKWYYLYHRGITKRELGDVSGALVDLESSFSKNHSRKTQTALEEIRTTLTGTSDSGTP